MEFKQGDAVSAKIGNLDWQVGIFQKFSVDEQGHIAAEVICGSGGKFLAEKIKPLPEASSVGHRVNCAAVPPRYCGKETAVRYVNREGCLHEGVIEEIQATSYQYRIRTADGSIELLTEVELAIGIDSALALEESI